MRCRIAVVFLLFVATASCVSTFTYGKQDKSNFLKISFADKPPKTFSQGEVHTIQVLWENRAKQQSVEGQFVFIHWLKKEIVSSTDLVFWFNGSRIFPIAQDGTLVYYLPSQLFPAQSNGSVSVDVIYRRSGDHEWEIGVAY